MLFHRWDCPLRTPATERQRLPPKERLRKLPRGEGARTWRQKKPAPQPGPTDCSSAMPARCWLKPTMLVLRPMTTPRQLAVLMLDEQNSYPCVEVWDRTRLVCTVRREG